MDVVYAVDTANVMMPNGQMELVHRGEPKPSSHPLVLFKPELFSTDAGFYLRGEPTAYGADGLPVESATAAPGERRNVRARG